MKGHKKYQKRGKFWYFNVCFCLQSGWKGEISKNFFRTEYYKPLWFGSAAGFHFDTVHWNKTFWHSWIKMFCWIDPKCFVSSQLSIRLHLPIVAHCFIGAVGQKTNASILLYELRSLAGLYDLLRCTCSHAPRHNAPAVPHSLFRGMSALHYGRCSQSGTQPIGENGVPN